MNWIDRLRDLNTKNQHLMAEGRPFIIFLVIALGGMIATGVYARFQYLSTFEIVAIGLLSSVYLSMHWFNGIWLAQERTAWMYVIVQAILAGLLVWMLPLAHIILALFTAMIGVLMGTPLPLRFKAGGLVINLAEMLAAFNITGGGHILNEWLTVIISTTVVLIVFGIVYTMQEQARERTEALLGELRSAHYELARYADQVEELTLASERQRLARDLHDTLSQGLVGVTLKLEAVSAHIDQNNAERAQDILHDARDEARKTLAEARMAIDDLRSGDADESSFSQMAQAEAARFTETTGIPCETQFSTEIDLDPETKQQALRMIAEGLNNIAQHAQASQASLTIQSTNNAIHMHISDDGKGIQADDQGKPGHYGLLGIRERVELLGGVFEIEGQTGLGTTMTITLPLHREAQHD